MNDNKKSYDRHYGIAILRVVATFSIIVIHVSGPRVIQFEEISMIDWHIANFYDSMSRYAVPLFFMISGALLLDKEYSLTSFFKKRFFRIVPPFIFWSLVFAITNRYVFNNEVFNAEKVVKDIFKGSEYHLWFIYALLGVYLLVPILRRWVKSAPRLEIHYFLLLWLSTLIIAVPGVQKYIPAIDLLYFSGFIGYFVLGYYLRKWRPIRKLFSVLLIILGGLVTYFGTYLSTRSTGSFYAYFYDYLNINTLLVAMGVFSLLLKTKVKTSFMRTSIATLDKASFGIFLIHPLVLQVFRTFDFNTDLFHSGISISTISLTCFLLSYIVITAIRQVKWGHLIT